MKRVGFAGIVLSLSIACSQGPDINYSGPTDNWTEYGGSPGGGHYSRATQITPANVSALEQAWIFESPEYLSPTQPFPVKPVPLHPYGLRGEDLFQLTPFDTSCADQLATIRDEGIFTPLSTEGTLMYPSPLGGNNWGSPALDQARNSIVLNTSRVSMVFTLVPRDKCAEVEDSKGYRPQHGTPYCVIAEPLVSSIGFPCNGTPLGTLVSVDLTTGDINWEVPLGSLQDMVPLIGRFFKGAPTLGGPMMTQSGLVFIASTPDHHIRAFDTETGEELWKGRLPEAGIATPMSYRLSATGKQYVVIAAGGHWGLPAADGAYLVAFALPN